MKWNCPFCSYEIEINTEKKNLLIGPATNHLVVHGEYNRLTQDLNDVMHIIEAGFEE